MKLFVGSGGYGNGEQRRDFVYVDDVVDGEPLVPRAPQRLGRVSTAAPAARRASTSSPRAVINAVQGTRRSVKEMAEKSLIEYVPFPPGLLDKYQSFTQADLTQPARRRLHRPRSRPVEAGRGGLRRRPAEEMKQHRRRLHRQHAAGAAAAPRRVRDKNIILAKLEGNNPAGSVKDRPAISMIRRAEERGRIKPGDTLIEPTSGNTGIALAMAAAIRGYRMVLIMPEHLSVERRQTMRAFGAEIILTPQTGGMEAARDLAESMVREKKGTMLDQFANPDNPLSHYETTGPEIWRDTDGKITHFVSSMGTTGTIMGCSRFFKEKNPKIQIIGCQPAEGSQIPGIRKWPEAYLPKIYDRQARRPRRVGEPGRGRGDDAAPGARGGHLRRHLLRRRAARRAARLEGAEERGDRHHRLRPRRPLPVHRSVSRTR